jgi:hypothetical protein
VNNHGRTQQFSVALAYQPLMLLVLGLPDAKLILNQIKTPLPLFVQMNNLRHKVNRRYQIPMKRKGNASFLRKRKKKKKENLSSIQSYRQQDIMSLPLA